MTWHEQAACKGMDPELFHPVRGNTVLQVRALRDICAGCPVIGECREHAILHEHHGFWGGMTEEERRAAARAAGIRRRAVRTGTRDLPPHGTPARYQQHLREGSPTCVECRAAKAAVIARYKAERRERQREASA